MVISLPIDANGKRTLGCASSADGVTPVAIKASPTTHTLSVSDGSGGTNHGANYAERDANYQPLLIAVSSVDGVTPVEVYGNAATGEILVQST